MEVLRIRALPADKFTFTAALRGVAEAWSRAISLTTLLGSCTVQADAMLCATAAASLPREEWAKACQTLQSARACHVEVDVALTNAALSPLVSSGGDWHLVLGALDVLRDQGMQPSETSLSLSLRMCSWPAAVQLIGSGKEMSVQPNLHVLAAALPSLSKTWAQGLALRRAAALKGLGWDAVSANLVAASCATCGCWAESLQQLPAQGRDEVSFGIAVDCCGQGRLWDSVLRLLTSLRAQRLEASGSAFGAAAVQHWSQAIALLRWLRQIGDVESAGNALAAAVQSCTSTAPGRWALALSLLHRPTGSVLNAALAAGQRGHAWQICLELVQSRGARPDTVAFNAAASTLASGAQWREGLLLTASTAGETTQVTLGAAARACEFGSAWRLAGSVLHLVQVFSLQIGQVIYGSVASSCEQTCRWSQAQQLLAELMQRCLRPNPVLGNTVASATSRASAWKHVLLLVVDPCPAMPPGAFVALLRAVGSPKDPGEPEDLEVLLQCRAQHLKYPGTWGLPGGQLGWEEAHAYYDHAVEPSLRERIVRRAALRELLEEAAAGSVSTGSKTTIYFEPLRVEVSGEQAVKLSRKDWHCHMPAGLSFFEVDAARSRRMKVAHYDTFIFVYVICNLRDGDEFAAGGSWRPREGSGGYEVDTSRGFEGYRWKRLGQLDAATGADEELCPWLLRFFHDNLQEFTAAARELQAAPEWTRPEPTCTWKTPTPRRLFQLLAVAVESKAWIQQRDRQHFTLADWQAREKGGPDELWTAQLSELVRRLFTHLQAAPPTERRGRYWGARSPLKLMLLCADAAESEDFQRYRDDSNFGLLDWQSWASTQGEAMKEWMKERSDLLLQLCAACAEHAKVDQPFADLGTDLLATAACESTGHARELVRLLGERLSIRSARSLHAARSQTSPEGLFP
ncbi:unnamed protein product [Symbiodinium natans]|uniref:Pentatricopeptide repeat-containing protein, chloroplastic n=1 Tax=Symbiodinium natans TaxID=878477 RepID=A0A812VFU1_9DINO|nr:unnamed protein product [Symbiodinium natans]